MTATVDVEDLQEITPKSLSFATFRNDGFWVVPATDKFVGSVVDFVPGKFGHS